jgi:hypothetical protein
MPKPLQHPIDQNSGANSDSDSNGEYETEIGSRSSEQGSTHEEETYSDEDEQVPVNPFQKSTGYNYGIQMYIQDYNNDPGYEPHDDNAPNDNYDNDQHDNYELQDSDVEGGWRASQDIDDPLLRRSCYLNVLSC